MSQTLVLDNAYRPHRIVPWQRAVTLLFLNRVEVVEEYSDRQIHSVAITIQMPAVVRLVNALAKRRHGIKFSRLSILSRDEFSCRYCGRRAPIDRLTYDHVIPKSQGGKTTWENIVTACRSCNRKKDNRTPDQAGMRLLSKPVKPTSLPITTFHWDPDQRPPDVWATWLYWHGKIDGDR